MSDRPSNEIAGRLRVAHVVSVELRVAAADEIDRLTRREAELVKANIELAALLRESPQEAGGIHAATLNLVLAHEEAVRKDARSSDKYSLQEVRECRLAVLSEITSLARCLFQMQEAAKALAKAPHEPGEICAWAYVDDGSWLTNCGESAILENGGTAYSDMRFCCFCGKPTP